MTRTHWVVRQWTDAGCVSRLLSQDDIAFMAEFSDAFKLLTPRQVEAMRVLSNGNSFSATARLSGYASTQAIIDILNKMVRRTWRRSRFLKLQMSL